MIGLTATAFPVASEAPPAPPAAQRVASLDLGEPEVAGHETAGRFALGDSAVHGTFQVFDVPDDLELVREGESPDRVGRIEARGLRTAIAAWWDSGELRIFRSENARGGGFACSCRRILAGEPGPGRLVAEALACMDAPVGLSGLELRVTRERELDAPGAITRAVRGMPDSGACAPEL